jgi:hypothetical protein
LRPDGVAYVRLGRRASTLSRRAGLEPGPALIELGDLLVPAERDALRWAARARPSSRRAAVAVRLPPRLAAWAGRGVVARHPGSRPLAEWLHARGRGTSVVVAGETALLVEDGDVTLAARVEPGPGSKTAAERRALLELGPDARAAGAEVPTPLDAVEISGGVALVVSGVAGTPASELIRREPSFRHALVDRVARWLARWNGRTEVERELAPELLERALLGPARTLGLEAAHVAALERLADAAARRRVKLVAAHNDLTTANVLVARDRPLGIVDWESARAEDLPVADLIYAVADAEAAAHGFSDRVAAFVASLDRQAEHEAHLTRALELDPLVADVCFHACWLRHAANERAAGGEAAPFLEIVRTIGARRLRLDEAA